jgi:hypothetical protein
MLLVILVATVDMRVVEVALLRKLLIAIVVMPIVAWRPLMLDMLRVETVSGSAAVAIVNY